MTTSNGIGMTSLRTRERLVARLQEKGIRDMQVLGAIRDVPRHLFVDEALASRAYEDTALPIGLGQTISQPFVVARMTELLRAAGNPGRVLEVGTGCGYQSAVLAALGMQVYTVERIESLVQAARERFHALGIHGVRVKYGDGFAGWEAAAPFDGIIVTAAPERVPEALPDQLAAGARMVLPVGPAHAQRLVCLDRDHTGALQRSEHDFVSFVPMLGGTV